ncbi:hypothetical protein ATO6_19780 [Oceanicola sp. 22II-s10i]|uniref:IclR family transcriptional regulator n=1 Tax=Oceanicola sp. 22II-s10i TaxID=1317116 RepID=UPI000B5244EA|nr:IclR family transcriptional regulator [Oceanicola sp. 22II-s10i]OWU83108.1 hypothetical protein ATO6_19780 [Oceanicola sp. 22II-s10i]
MDVKFEQMEGHGRPQSGTQALDRAMTILAELASHAPLGVRLIDLSRAAGLTRPTTHRILQALRRVGLVVQESSGRRYKLGSLALALESAAPPKLLIDAARDHMTRISEETGEMTLLTSRQGRFGVVAASVRGRNDFINANQSVAKVGYVSLLGSSAASLAVFSRLDDAQVEEILFANEWNVLTRGGLGFDDMMNMVAEVRRLGYARTQGFFIPGIGAVSAPIHALSGQCYGAITIFTKADDMTAEFAASLAPMLTDAAHAIATELDHQRGAGEDDMDAD